MTLYIDDELLGRVMEATGATSKTKAVDLALREIDRRAKLVKLSAVGLGLTADELKDAIDPRYNLQEVRNQGRPVTYARKSTARRQ